jgi:excisionase family DNA binding protein
MQKSTNNADISNEPMTLTIVIAFINLFKVAEAANFLNMSESSLLELIAKGEIPFKKINGEIHIREYELWDWMYKQNPIMIKNENPAFDIFAN